MYEKLQLNLEDVIIEVRCLALPEQELVDTFAASLFGSTWIEFFDKSSKLIELIEPINKYDSK